MGRSLKRSGNPNSPHPMTSPIAREAASPYSVRIMAALPGQEPVEMFRTNRTLHPHDWRFWTNDLSPDWELWTEHRLPDRQCISSRPAIKRPTGSEKLRLHLTPEQRTKLYET